MILGFERVSSVLLGVRFKKVFIVKRALGKDDATFLNALVFFFSKKFQNIFLKVKKFLFSAIFSKYGCNIIATFV